MPEITEAQLREYQRYQQFGTPDEVDGKAKKLETVLGENKGYRLEIKALKEEAPPEGAVVLTGDDAAKWTKVKDVDVDDLTAKAAKTAELETEIAKRDKGESRRKAAEAEGYDVSVLESIAGADALEYEAGEVADPRDAARKVPAGFVVVDGKKVRLSDYAKEKFPRRIVEALAATGGKASGGGHTATPERPAGGGDKTAGAGVDALREANLKAAQAPNALRPAKTT
jgi:hypothetical protein